MSAPEEATRFESHVDRSGEHHIWLGSRNPQRGTGKLKVDGKQVTAHRLPWKTKRSGSGVSAELTAREGLGLAPSAA